MHQVEEAQATIQITSGDRHHQAQVALDEMPPRALTVFDEALEPLALELVDACAGGQLAGGLSASFHTLRQADFVSLGQQVVIGNLAQVHCARATTQLLIDAERPAPWLGYLGRRGGDHFSGRLFGQSERVHLREFVVGDAHTVLWPSSARTAQG